MGDGPTTLGAITAETFGNLWRANRALAVMGAAAIIAAGVVVNPLMFLTPLILLVLPVTHYWHSTGVLAEIKPWQTHPLTLAATTTAGVLGGLYLSLRHPSALTEFGWSVHLLAVSVGLATLATVFRATSPHPMSDAVEAGRVMLIAAVLLMVGMPAWIANLVSEGDGVVGHTAGVVLSGSVVTAAWIVAVTLPRRTVRSGDQASSDA